MEAKILHLSKKLNEVETDMTSYEKIVQRKVYNEHNHEYSELKRQGGRLGNIIEDIKIIKRV